ARRHRSPLFPYTTRFRARGAVLVIAHSYLGLLFLAQGDLEHAIPVLERGLALCRASDNRNDLYPTVAGLGYASVLHGRLAEGRRSEEHTSELQSRSDLVC